MQLLRPKSFSKYKLFEKIGLATKSAGIIVIYPALVLYYLFQDKNVPTRSKSMIVAALAYFIFPIDSIPDMTPIIGYSDDIGVLYVTIMQLVKYITPDILIKVKIKIADWFGEIKVVEKQEQRFLKKINNEKETE